MPEVDGKKYPYTKKGKMAAKKARKRSDHSLLGSAGRLAGRGIKGAFDSMNRHPVATQVGLGGAVVAGSVVIPAVTETRRNRQMNRVLEAVGGDDIVQDVSLITKQPVGPQKVMRNGRVVGNVPTSISRPDESIGAFAERSDHAGKPNPDKGQLEWRKNRTTRNTVLAAAAGGPLGLGVQAAVRARRRKKRYDKLDQDTIRKHGQRQSGFVMRPDLRSTVPAKTVTARKKKLPTSKAAWVGVGASLVAAPFIAKREKRKKRELVRKELEASRENFAERSVAKRRRAKPIQLIKKPSIKSQIAGTALVGGAGFLAGRIGGDKLTLDEKRRRAAAEAKRRAKRKAESRD